MQVANNKVYKEMKKLEAKLNYILNCPKNCAFNPQLFA